MSKDAELQKAITANEQEWRRLLWKRQDAYEAKLDKVDAKVNNLRVQNAFFAALIGYFGGMVNKLKF